MSVSLRMFEGCYEAARAAALAGVPLSTVYDWARKDIVVPSISEEKPKLWSYADLMALRIVYWLRHPKDSGEAEIPATTMRQVRRALHELREIGADLWTADERGHTTPVLVDRRGRIHIDHDAVTTTLKGQGLLSADYIDPLGPFDIEHDWGPDLRRPKPHLRIVPGKLSGEPHLAHSRLTTQTVAALADRGYSAERIHRLYPNEDLGALSEAVELERQLAA